MFVFSQKDLDQFAHRSGDWNPIHTSPSVARRLIAGEIVVHGIFVLLCALNEFCRGSDLKISSIKCRFLKPIFLKTKVNLDVLSADELSAEIIVYCNSLACVSIAVKFGGNKNYKKICQGAYVKASANNYNFERCKKASGDLPVKVNLNYLEQNFPELIDNIGIIPIQSLMLCSKIVGMDCPGLNSLFSSLDMKLDTEQSPSKLSWFVQRHTVPIAPIKIGISGGGLSGHIESFYRPVEVKQESFTSISEKVDSDIFKNQRALVIGASRGLGELTAKVIIAGGGEVIGTFCGGENDARRLEQEIRPSNQKFKMVQLDITTDDKGYLSSFFKTVMAPTHIYYFASPRIKSNNGDGIDNELLNIYRQFFVTSFSNIVEVVRNLFAEKVTILYPSTTFIDESVPDFKEYVAAKLEGERLYPVWNDQDEIEVVCHRLPRLKTDQTAGILTVDTADNFEEILKIIKVLS